MQKCEKCGVDLRTPHKVCPLCHGVLTGEFDENDRLFPLVKPQKVTVESVFMQWFTFGAIAIAVISVLINYLTVGEDGTWWCLFVLGALLCTWLVTAMAVAKRRNVLKSVVWQLVIVVALCYFWDKGTGWHRWSINYVLPIAILAALVALITVALARRLTSPEYMVYLLMVCLDAVVPLILMLTGVVTTPLPSVICIAVCVLALAALAVFRGKAMKTELGKKFHV